MSKVICVNAAPTFGGVQKCFLLSHEKYSKLHLEDFPIQGTRFCYKIDQKQSNASLVIYYNEQNSDTDVFGGGAPVKADAIFSFWGSCDNDARLALQRILLPTLIDTTTELYKSCTSNLDEVCSLLQDLPCPLVYAVYSFRLVKQRRMEARGAMSEWKHAVPPLDDRREWVAGHRAMARYIMTTFWAAVKEPVGESSLEFYAWAYLPCLEKPSIAATRDPASKNAVKEIAKARLAASTNLSSMVRSAYLKVLGLTEDDVAEKPWFPLRSPSVDCAPQFNDEWAPGLTRQDFCRWEAADAFHAVGMMSLREEGQEDQRTVTTQFFIEKGARRQLGTGEDMSYSRCPEYLEEMRVPEVLRKSSFFGVIRKKSLNENWLDASRMHLSFFLRAYEADEKDTIMCCVRDWLVTLLENGRSIEPQIHITAQTIETLADELVREAFYAHEEMLLKVKSATHYVRCSLAAALTMIVCEGCNGDEFRQAKSSSRFKLLDVLKRRSTEPLKMKEDECVKDLS